MALIKVARRIPGVLVTLIAIAVVMVVSQPASSSTVSIAFGAISVTATPSTKLTDGQAVAIHVQAVPAVVMFDVQVHLCQSGAGVKNGFEFDFDGPYCSPYKVSPAADAGAEQRVAATNVADLTFHVGEGTSAPWQETDAGTHTLTCGPGAPCDLVVQIAATGTNLYAAVPLCFGAECPVEPDPAPPPAAAGTGGSGAAGQGGTAAAGASGNAKGSTGQASGSTGAATGTDAPGGAAASASPKSSPGGASDAATSGEGTTALAVPAVASDTSPTIATWRIILAGLAGLLCGARIVSVIGRARRKTALGFA